MDHFSEFSRPYTHLERAVENGEITIGQLKKEYAELTAVNAHTEATIFLDRFIGGGKESIVLGWIKSSQDRLGYLTDGDLKWRDDILNRYHRIFIKL